MAGDFTIRSGSAEDADAVAWLHWQGWETTYRDLMPESLILARDLELRRAEWRERLRTDLRTMLIAEDRDGEPIAFLRAEPHRFDPLRLPPDGSFDAEISYLYVAPAWQGRGVGRALLRELAQRMLAAGQKRLLVVAFKGNPFARFYRRMGASLLREEAFVLDGWAGYDIYFGWDDVTDLAAG